MKLVNTLDVDLVIIFLGNKTLCYLCLLLVQVPLLAVVALALYYSFVLLSATVALASASLS